MALVSAMSDVYAKGAMSARGNNRARSGVEAINFPVVPLAR